MTALLFASTAQDWQSLQCQLLKDFLEVAQAYPVWNCKLPSKQFGLQIVKNPKQTQTRQNQKSPQTSYTKIKPNPPIEIQNMVLQKIYAFELELPSESGNRMVSHRDSVRSVSWQAEGTFPNPLLCSLSSLWLGQSSGSSCASLGLWIWYLSNPCTFPGLEKG